MKPLSGIRATFRSMMVLALASAGLSLGLLSPKPVQSAAVELATVPMANSASITVKPNIMFVLDDSGSMAWDYMPTTAANFVGRYGFYTSQCNGTYYNPVITYSPPVNSTGAPLNATATSFGAAYNNGYDTSVGTTDLNTQYSGGSGSGSPAAQFASPGPAFYYTYSGAQTSAAQKDYFNTSSIFYQECNSVIGSTTVIGGAAVNTRFSMFRLAAIPTTTITVSAPGAGAGASVKFSSNGNSRTVNGITLGAGGSQIMSGITASSTSSSNMALAVAGKINACTSAAVGTCTVSGYSATIDPADNTNVLISGAASSVTPVVSISSSGWTITTNPFPPSNATTVGSITVGGTLLLSSAATGSTPSALAIDIKNKITAAGYSATVSGSVVTVTAPTTASNLTPVITVSSGTMTLATLAFPESTPAKLQNFANWYSYYSHRMLMMKTGTGLAFSQVSDKFRVGFVTMNNNVSPGIVEVDTFTGTQKTKWYNKLYASVPSNSTPLREILSKVGQYYAHKFGTVSTYKATITVGGSGATSVTSIKVNGVEITSNGTVPLNSTSAVAAAVSTSIDSLEVTDFGTQVSGNVITILGPASAAGVSPVVTSDLGGMTFGVTAFATSTVTNTLNGIIPADPMQYSCQQNFTILSTDGYWNGANTYDLNGNPVGQQDGTLPRPYNDGQVVTSTDYTYTYTRNSFSKVTVASCTGSTGGVSNKTLQTQPQLGTCVASTATSSCTPGTWISNGAATQSGCDTTSAPSPSAPVLQGTPVLNTVVTGGVANTLADVALYYYQTDLRDPLLGNCTGALGTSVCLDNVFTSGNDSNTNQHMTTFTLGLGGSGRMIYSPSYLTDTTGDFVAVKLGLTASATQCTWQTAGTVCTWPAPSSGAVENIDDLWHAAINGRGAYFSATDPLSLANGLSNALTSIKSKEGAAAAAATSTLNPVAGNNLAFVASYSTIKWIGNLEARGINTDTGVVNENATWCVENVPADSCPAPGTVISDASGNTTAYFCSTPNSTVCTGGTLVGSDCRVPVATACTGTMGTLVSNASDSRTIYTAKNDGTALVPFDTAYRATNSTLFDSSKLSGLSQWPPASDTSTAANTFRSNAVGDRMLQYLRGQWGNETGRSAVAAVDQLYRGREAIMGDALESQPAFLAAPTFSYPYPGYSAFKTAQASRLGTVYMGTNDGMLHAFNSATGVERWAYVPSMVVPNMWRLADLQYADKHTNYVNGTAITSDICVSYCNNTSAPLPVWKTILVAGLNGGGRGYYALDITNPSSPSLLWEFTTTAGFGKVKDDDLGYTFGQPVVTLKADGTWVVVVSSGYDNGTDSATKVSGSFVANSPAGTGRGYLYVLNANTGAIISKIDTGVGTAASPSGLGKVAGFNTEPTGNKASLFYGGDLLGNLWRFDINSTTTATIGTGSVLKFATLFSDTGAANPQPIMTTPQLGKILGKRVVFIGTGKYLETGDLSTNQVQTQYAIKDDDATTTLVNPRNSLVQQYLITNPAAGQSNTRLSSGASGTTASATNTVDFTTGRGWFVDFPADRERVNIDSKLILGTLIVPTIVPSATECSPGGSGFLNFFNYQTGGAIIPTPGIASVAYASPIVGFNVIFIDGSPIVLVTGSTLPTPKGDPNVKFQGGAAVFAGKRVLWRELIP